MISLSLPSNSYFPNKKVWLNKQILSYTILCAYTMSSSLENINLERETVIVQVNLYKQMWEQLLAELKRYQLQNKAELVKIISESI
jgi:hypothetical protein